MHITYSPHSSQFISKLNNLKKHFPAHAQKIKKYSFASLPWQKLSESSAKFKLPKKISEIFLVGIGGSSQGAKALNDALGGYPIFFLDNIDPHFIASKLSGISAKNTFFILVSKSGETAEVLALSNIILKKFHSRPSRSSAKQLMRPKGATFSKFLVITDNPKSSLGKLAHRYKLPLIKSDAKIPGRFSVLSNVGLLPARIAGLSIKNLLLGSRAVSWEDAHIFACYQYLHYRAKKNIVVLFPYSESLDALCDWYIQLLAESIGKSARIGITPVKAMGVRDQHSQLQLFLDGPDDKFFIFITRKNRNKYMDLKIPNKPYTMEELFNAEYQGVKSAFLKRKKSFVEIQLPQLNELSLGELFFFFELEIAFLGTLFKVNIENQPAVELNKRLAKTHLY